MLSQSNINLNPGNFNLPPPEEKPRSASKALKSVRTLQQIRKMIDVKANLTPKFIKQELQIYTPTPETPPPNNTGGGSGGSGGGGNSGGGYAPPEEPGTNTEEPDTKEDDNTWLYVTAGGIGLLLIFLLMRK